MRRLAGYSEHRHFDGTRAPHGTVRRCPRQLCELWQRRKPDGEPEDKTCRLALLRMQANGLIELPSSRMRPGRHRPSFATTPATGPGTIIECYLHHLGALSLHLVSGKKQSWLWNEFVVRYL